MPKRAEVGYRQMFLSYLFQEDDEEIVRYVAKEVDKRHRKWKREMEKEEGAHRDHWHSQQSEILRKLSERCGYSGMKKLLPYVKDPYAIEDVLTLLVGAAKREGVPKEQIESMKELQKIRKETRWRLLNDYKVEDSSSADKNG